MPSSAFPPDRTGRVSCDDRSVTEPSAAVTAASPRARLSPRVAAVAIATVAAGAAIVLSVMGRSVWCGCASLVPWSFDVWSAHNSQHVLDPYTFTHVLHGFGFYAITFLALSHVLGIPARLLVAAVLEAAWEVLENTPMVIEKYRTETMSLDYFGDSVINSVADIGACVLGFWIASKLSARVSIALFVATEIVLLLWVRDSLLVNILQLLWPIAAIKTWQMGAAAP